MRAVFAVEALVGQAQALDGTTANQMLLDNRGGIGWLHVAVPDGFGIDHHHRTMLALVQTAGFVDTHSPLQSGGFGQLLQLGVQVAGAIRGTGAAGGVGGTGVGADKNVMFKSGQWSDLYERNGVCF